MRINFYSKSKIQNLFVQITGIFINFWNKLFFAKQDLYTLGLFRIIFGSYLLFILIITYPYWERFFSHEGILQTEFIKIDNNIFQVSGYPLSILFFIKSTQSLFLLFWINLFVVICFILGFQTRLATILLLLINSSKSAFYLNSLSADEPISMGLLLCSCFAPLNCSLSVDKLFIKTKNYAVKSVFGFRLLQSWVLLIYFCVGLTKLLCPYWRSGEAFFYVTAWEYAFKYTHILSFHNIYLSKFITYSTLFIEILLPPFLCFRQTWLFAFIILFAFHMGIALVASPGPMIFDISVLISLTLFIPSALTRKFVGFFIPKLSTVQNS